MINSKLVQLIFMFLCNIYVVIHSLPVNHLNKSSETILTEIAKAKTPEIIEQYNYPVEIHKILTDDGYILEIHRIPNSGGVPIYLQHGLLDSSAAWTLMGPNHSLAFLLADLGYDVWLGNSRGNHYSRQHITLTENGDKFWDFSWHEIGVYDLPAIIDYILNLTKFPKLHYIGHSQGTTTFWVMCSERPNYCDKILSMHALAPIAYFDKVESLFIPAMTKVLGPFRTMTNLFGINEFMPRSNLMQSAGLTFCNSKAITRHICSNIIFLIAGFNSESMNMTMLPVIIGHLPAGASVKQMLHFGQIKKSGIFRQFDYGIYENHKKYHSAKPPQYNFNSITAPIYFYYSENDLLASVADVNKLYAKLPNTVDKYLITDPKFNHLDFLIATNVQILLYDQLIQNIQKYDNH